MDQAYDMKKQEESPFKASYRMTYDQHRDDQLNTGVIAALIGGFSLTNVWELESTGSFLDTSIYVLSIFAVHACTCSALTSAFLYQILTRSDPEKAEAWMAKRSILARLPFVKFLLGTLAYMASVILVAWRELEDKYEAKMVALGIGAVSGLSLFSMVCYIVTDPPSKTKTQ